MDRLPGRRRFRVLARAALLVLPGTLVAPLVLTATADAATPALTTFTPGDVVVYQVGSGSGSLSSAAAPVLLEEYAPSGGTNLNPLGQVALPVATTGSENALTASGSANSEGLLTLSADSKDLVVTGYDAASGASKVANGTAPRTVGEVDANADVNTTTAINDFSGNNVRGAAALTGGAGAGVYMSGASGGVAYTTIGSSAFTTLDSSVSNTRQVAIAGDQLYVSADPTKSNSPAVDIATMGSGLPTTAGQAASNLAFSSAPTQPYAFSFLTLGTGSTPDTPYVADNGSNTIEKYCLLSGTWKSSGSVAVSNVTGVTANDASGTVSIFATSEAGLYEITDSSGLCGTLSGSASLIATPGANEVFYGVAFAPGTVIGSGGGTVQNAPPTIATAAAGLAAALGDPTNPSTTVTVGDATYGASGVSVTATASTDPAVATTADVALSGTGATRTVTITPTGAVGTTTITLTASAPDGTSSTATIDYGVSTNLGDASQRYYSDAGNGSTEIDVGGGYMIVGDDESNVLRLYNENESGPPVKTFDFTSIIGTKEIDIEASARVGNTLYWTGSMSNNSDGSEEPTRSTLFAATISGSGANTNLTFVGDYTGLQQDLVNWDEHDGSGLGANYLGFQQANATGMTDHAPNAFNVEGMEFAPGSSSTAYLAFRAPLEPYGNGGSTEGSEAVLVPVTDINQLVNNGESNTSGLATFGAPIFWNLGTDPSTGLGLGIREIRDNEACATNAAACTYLIIAGTGDGSNDDFLLYNWDGVASDPPLLSPPTLPIEPTAPNQGAWEGIVSVPDDLSAGDQVELVQDDGDVDWYGIGQTSKTGLLMDLQKDLGQTFTYQAPVALTSATTLGSSENPAYPGDEVTYTATVTPPAGSLGTPTGTVQFDDDGSPISGCSATVLSTSGVATCTTSYSTTASQAIDAVYSGDGSFANSGSSTLTEQLQPIAVTITPENQSISYGDPDPTFSFMVTGLRSGDSLSTLPTCGVSGTHTAAGTYTITCSGASASSIYAISYGTATLTVGQAALSITPDNQSITFGQADPTFTFSPSGLLSGDSVPTGVSCGVSGAHADAGSYTISCTGPASAGNYAVTYGAATLTVAPAQVSIVPDAQSITFGGASPAFSYSVSGLVGGDALTSEPTCGIAGGTPTNAGQYTITCSGAAADSNYVVGYQTALFTIAPATVTVTPDNQTVTYGEPTATFTYTVDGLLGGDALTTPPTCGVTGDDSAVGTYTISCSGATADNNYVVVEASATLTVAQVVSAVTVTADNDPAVTGQPVTLTATVAPATTGQGGSTVPTGTVEFSIDGTDIPGCSSVTLGATGTATCAATTGFLAGSDPVAATYSGDAVFTASSQSAFTETVNADSTTSALTADNTSVVSGQAVTLTAVVTVNTPGSDGPGSPTGTIAFDAGGSPIAGCGAVTLEVASSTAQCLVATGFTPPGPTITAKYSGDSNFESSVAPSLAESVSKDSPVIAVVANPTTPVPGQSLQLTANVTAAAPGGGTPTGSVVFAVKASHGANPTCTGGNTVNLTDGNASCSITATAVASGVTYDATVTYAGNADFTSASGSLSSTAGLAPTTLGLTTSANPIVSGTAVTLRATLSTTAGHSGSYAGTITFEVLAAGGEASPACRNGDTVTISGATASCALASGLLDAGGSPYEITASYGGNANYLPSSSSLAETVDIDPTTTKVTVAPASVVTGQSVTFRAAITPASHVPVRPTGSVEFAVSGSGGDSITCAGSDSVTLVSTSAVCTIASGQIRASDAPYAVTATYSGDANYATSSASLSEAVAARATRLGLRSSSNPVAPSSTLQLSATITPVGSGSAAVSGSVAFSISGTGSPSCVGGDSVPLNGDLATCTIVGGTFAASSSYAVSASFAGNGDFGQSAAGITQRTSKGTSGSIPV